MAVQYTWYKYRVVTSYSYRDQGYWGAWGAPRYVSGNISTTGYVSFGHTSGAGFWVDGFRRGDPRMGNVSLLYLRDSATQIRKQQWYFAAQEPQEYPGQGGLMAERFAYRYSSLSSSKSRGSYIGAVTASYNYKVNNAANSDGYWWVRGGRQNAAPSAPKVTAPTGTVDGTKRIAWNAASDDYTATASLKYQVQISIAGGAYKDLVAKTVANRLYYDYNFYNIDRDTTCQIRVRAQDGDGAWGAYGYGGSFKILREVTRVRKGTVKVRKSGATITLPLWERNDMMAGVDQLRVRENGYNGCFELVRTNDKFASPVRVRTANGTRAISTNTAIR